MKEVICVILAIIIVVLPFSACGESGTQFVKEPSKQSSIVPTTTGLSEEEMNIAILALNTLDDYLFGYMSLSGAHTKIESYSAEFNTIQSDSTAHSIVSANFLIIGSALTLFAEGNDWSRNKFVEVEDARDHFAAYIGEKELFATSKRDVIIEELDKAFNSYYDPIKSDHYIYSTNKVYRYIYRINKNEDPVMHLYVFYSSSNSEFLYISASALGAYIASEQYENVIMDFYYNAEHVATFSYDFSEQETAKDLRFSDNLIELAQVRDYHNPEFQKEFERDDTEELIDAIEYYYNGIRFEE